MPSAQKSTQQMKMRSKEFNWDHAMEAAENMLRLAEIVAPMQQEIERKKRKLQEFPKGYPLEGSYTCSICYGSCSELGAWYDQYGIKCRECQDAVDRGNIPATCAGDLENHFSPSEIERAFNVDRHVVRRWAKAGILKARTVKHAHHMDTHMFLLEDNKDILPPKKMVEHRSRHEPTPDGRTTVHIDYWYEHVDPFVYLKGYKILEQFEMVNGKFQAKPKEDKRKKK